MADQRIPADDGRGYPYDGIPARTIYTTPDLSRVVDVVQSRHTAQRARSGVRSPAPRTCHPGKRHRRDAATTDDDGAAARIGRTTWRDHGDDHDRDRWGPRCRTDHRRSGAGLAGVALDVLDRSASRTARATHRRDLVAPRQRDTQRPVGHVLRDPVRTR